MLGTHSLQWCPSSDGVPVLWSVVHVAGNRGEPRMWALFGDEIEARVFLGLKGKEELTIEPLVLNRDERWHEDQLWVVTVLDSEAPDVWVWAVFAYRDDAEWYAERVTERVTDDNGVAIYKLGLSLLASLSGGDKARKPRPGAKAPPEEI